MHYRVFANSISFCTIPFGSATCIFRNLPYNVTGKVSGRRVQGSKLNSTEDLSLALGLNLTSWIKRLPVDAVWKLGDGGDSLGIAVVI
ncbi:hypothetical protein AVEN_162591-1 [Araneus ventricosus]|uniref:Uncharacterized protein n=1 Tax=Araneus ventricosus TaxID=182803 RepID=A0A4Y2MMN1_ARAVE|nr:hypothetical protein AVEN_162591-1 [Araneus ventricosus]